MAAEGGKVVWIVNHYAGSRIHGMEYRHYNFARHFQRMGLRPVIICASFHHLLTKPPAEPTGEVDGIPYVRIKTCRYQRNDIRRVRNMVGFTARLALRRLRHLPRPDAVIASSPHPLVALNGYQLAKRYGAKFIFEVRDLWPLTLIELGGYAPRHPFIRVMARIERFAYEHCDYTVSLFPGADRYMTAHGLEQRKFVYIPNGFDPETWRDRTEELPEDHAKVFRDLKQKGRRIVLYSGSHGFANALHHLIRAAALLKDEPRLHFVLVGQGPEKARLQELARQASLENITFLPPVSGGQMAALMREADLGYVSLQKKDLFHYGVSPNKLFEYMGGGLPILFAIDTIYDEVAEARCGFSVGAENPPALEQVLRQAVRMTTDELREMGERGRRHVRTTHAYEVLARQYARLF
jgi:glycosyltransferase involved in cell wall biosynthesis